jgi:lipoate-protein ligase A
MKINLLRLCNVPILEQLRIEEGLLRTDTENWLIINEGSPKSIVMGISGNPSTLIDEEKVTQDQIPLIQRFSGGGTVFVDEDTLFTTFIFQKEIHPFPPYPKEILHWVGGFFKEALPLKEFTIRDNDFTLGEKKIGGNAQYIRKDRWLHHTTFLWDFDPRNMEYLLHPPTEPSYREGRLHSDFITKIKPHLSKQAMLDAILNNLHSRFDIEKKEAPLLFPPHRTTTTQIHTLL